MFLSFTSCNKSSEDLDGKYTVSGRLFAGTSYEPLANVPVEIEGQREVAISKTEVYALGSTTTDASGFFSITYDQTHEDGAVKFENGNFVLLRTVQQVGGLIESLPWNTNVQRDFAQVDHSRVYVTLHPSSSVAESDSVYMSIGLMKSDQSFIEPMYFESVNRFYNVAKVDVGMLREGVHLKSDWGSTWDNVGRDAILAYGVTASDFQKAHLAISFDSIPNDFNRIEFVQRGFPFTDTIKLSF